MNLQEIIINIESYDDDDLIIVDQKVKSINLETKAAVAQLDDDNEPILSEGMREFIDIHHLKEVKWGLKNMGQPNSPEDILKHLQNNT